MMKNQGISLEVIWTCLKGINKILYVISNSYKFKELEGIDQ